MIIHHHTDSKGGRFAAEAEGRKAGEMTYILAGPTRIIIDHTEVEPQFAGQGVGYKLVLSAVEFARKRHLKILPLCPFARSVFQKHAELRDVL